MKPLQLGPLLILRNWRENQLKPAPQGRLRLIGLEIFSMGGRLGQSLPSIRANCLMMAPS